MRREKIEEELSVTYRRSTGTQVKSTLLEINSVNWKKKESVNLKKDR